MKILVITAGSGNLYCETCMRDRDQVRAWRRLGHDVLMVPLYLPPLAADPGDATAPIFLGGINAWLQQHAPLFRRTPAWVDNLFNARWLLNLTSRAAEMTNPRDLGPMTLSTLRGEYGNQGKEFRKLFDWLRTQERPDVIVLSNAMLLGFAEPLKRDIGAPVVCSLQGSETFIGQFPEAERAATWALLRELAVHVTHFIAISRHCAGVMQHHLGIPTARLTVIPNGLPPESFVAAPPAASGELTLGNLGQVKANTGLDTLAAAWTELRRDPRFAALRLAVGVYGDAERNRTVARVRRQLAHQGLTAAVTFASVPESAQKRAFLAGVSVLAAPIAYDEPFGLYVIEALAAGVPVVLPRRGAFPELIEQTGGGLLYEPDQPDALVTALATVLGDAALRTRLGAAGRTAAAAHYTLAAMAERTAIVLERAVATP